MQRVTIKDIARLAGVSVTTVSRALNHGPEISPETRERILRICREQGYRTNLLARSLISSRTNVLGLILPDIANPFHATLSFNIETYARELGYGEDEDFWGFDDEEAESEELPEDDE